MSQMLKNQISLLEEQSFHFFVVVNLELIWKVRMLP